MTGRRITGRHLVNMRSRDNRSLIPLILTDKAMPAEQFWDGRKHESDPLIQPRTIFRRAAARSPQLRSLTLGGRRNEPGGGTNGQASSYSNHRPAAIIHSTDPRREFTRPVLSSHEDTGWRFLWEQHRWSQRPWRSSPLHRKPLSAFFVSLPSRRVGCHDIRALLGWNIRSFLKPNPRLYQPVHYRSAELSAGPD